MEVESGIGTDTGTKSEDNKMNDDNRIQELLLDVREDECERLRNDLLKAQEEAERLRGQLTIIVNTARQSIKDWNDFERDATKAGIWSKPPGYLSPEFISDATGELVHELNRLDANPPEVIRGSVVMVGRVDQTEGYYIQASHLDKHFGKEALIVFPKETP